MRHINFKPLPQNEPEATSLGYENISTDKKIYQHGDIQETTACFAIIQGFPHQAKEDCQTNTARRRHVNWQELGFSLPAHDAKGRSRAGVNRKSL